MAWARCSATSPSSTRSSCTGIRKRRLTSSNVRFIGRSRIDHSVCQLVHRLPFFRFLSHRPADGLILARRRNRGTLLPEFCTELTKLRTTFGIARPIVTHMFRHTYATEMLRFGASFRH